MQTSYSANVCLTRWIRLMDSGLMEFPMEFPMSITQCLLPILLLADRWAIQCLLAPGTLHQCSRGVHPGTYKYAGPPWGGPGWKWFLLRTWVWFLELSKQSIESARMAWMKFWPWWRICVSSHHRSRRCRGAHPAQDYVQSGPTHPENLILFTMSQRMMRQWSSELLMDAQPASWIIRTL
jgi:hypothetical protein